MHNDKYHYSKKSRLPQPLIDFLLTRGYNTGMQFLRLFIALEVPVETQETLIRSFTKLPLDFDRIRPAREENLHITLKFLGETNIERLPAILATLDAAQGNPAPELSLGDQLMLPPRRPTVIAIAILSSQLESLARFIDEDLSHRGVSELERRAFRPHITIARIKYALDAYSRNLIAQWQSPELQFQSDTLTLFESTPSLHGSVYTPLKQTVLT